MAENRVEELALNDQFKQALEEARVMLPGIQALFGFQFIAVFNEKFAQLPNVQQRVHFFALLLTALAMISAMAPAALHRQAEPRSVSDRLVKLATFMLTFGMAPLGIAVVLDFFVVATIMLHDNRLATAWSCLLAGVILIAWFLFPWMIRNYLKKP